MQPFIETLDDPIILERVNRFRGGADSFNTPEDLPPDTSAIIQNMLVPDNLTLQTRYGADDIPGANKPSTDGTGKIQGISWFNPPAYNAGNGYLVAAANAKMYAYDGGAWSKLTTYTPSSTMALVSMANAMDGLYVTDGVASWGQWTGTGAMSVLGTNYGTGGSIGDPPVGASIIAWNGVRMLAAGLPNNSGNKTTPDTLMASLALQAGNASWDNVIWSVRIGAGDGDPIKALAPMQNNWLLVLKQKSLWLVYVDPTATSASNWTVQRLTESIGCVGKRAWAMNGNDIMFLARDGIRSVRRMAIGVDEYEVVPPVSEPVKAYIDRINWASASKVAAHRYKQWVVFALPLDGATENNFTLAFNTRTQTWMGIWTGWAPTEFATSNFSGAENLNFGDTAALVNKWKDDQDVTLPGTVKDNGVAIASLVRSKTFMFGEPVNEKDGSYFEVRFINTTNENIQVVFYMDDANQVPVPINTQQSAATFPLTLPFTLGMIGPQTFRCSLDAYPDFNQLYLEISASAKYMQIKNFTIGAFMNTLLNE